MVLSEPKCVHLVELNLSLFIYLIASTYSATTAIIYLLNLYQDQLPTYVSHFYLCEELLLSFL